MEYKPDLSQTFSILSPPKRAKLMAFANQAAGLSGLFAILSFYAAMEMRWPDEVPGQSFSWQTHGPFGGALPGNQGLFILFLVIGGLFLIFGLGVFIYRKIKPLTARKAAIGSIELSTQDVRIETGSEQYKWTWDQVKRLDVYLSYGMQISNRSDLNTLFNGTEALHLRFKTAQGFQSFHVLNSNNDLGKYGDLYQVLQQFRKLNIFMHRRIQFWNKQRTG